MNPNEMDYHRKHGHYPDGGRGMPPPPFPRYHCEHICVMCGNALTGRKQTFCSDECADKWYDEYSWDGTKRRVFKRDNWTCTKCGYRPNLNDLKCTDGRVRTFVDGYNLLHCHHIKPIADGGKTTLDNLQTLCTKCHKKEHTRIGNNRRKNKSMLAFLEVANQ